MCIRDRGILHHLDFSKCLDEISRILKPDGSMIFVEPLGTNPLINLYRKFTPNSRSIDEHPLIAKDFRTLKEKFKDVEIKYSAKVPIGCKYQNLMQFQCVESSNPNEI